MHMREKPGQISLNDFFQANQQALREKLLAGSLNEMSDLLTQSGLGPRDNLVRIVHHLATQINDPNVIRAGSMAEWTAGSGTAGPQKLHSPESFYVEFGPSTKEDNPDYFKFMISTFNVVRFLKDAKVIIRSKDLFKAMIWDAYMGLRKSFS